MNGGVVFLIILIILVIGGYGGWVFWSRMQANKLGLPPPSLNPFARSSPSDGNYPAPAPGGIRGWFDSQIRRFKNRNNRYASGAYEETSHYAGGRGRTAGNRLDPDEAWDTRVGNEGYYEEQELGLHPPPASSNTQYGNTAYNSQTAGLQPENERGRSRTREYEESLQSDARSLQNPFGDDNAAPSLRGVSPRPVDTSYGGAQTHAQKKVGGGGDSENSPTERRSMFRENM